MKKHTKVLASALTAMVVASAMAGCGSKKTDTGSNANGVPKGQKILVWSHLDADFSEFKKQAEQWAKDTGNTVTVVKDNNDMDKLLVAAKSPTAPDIMWGLPNDHVGKFAAAGILDEISSKVINPSDYVNPAMVDAGKVDGKQYALPIFAETYALFYNKDKVTTPPTTWEDMLTQGKLQWDVTNFYFSYGILATKGAYVFKNNNGTYDKNDIGLGNPDGYAVIKDLVDKGMIDKNTTGDVAKNNFKTGVTQFYISGPWDVSDIKKAGVNFGVVKLPTIGGAVGKSFMGVQMAYVVKKANRSADTKAAMDDLMTYLAKTDNLAAVGKAGNRLPAKKGITVEGVQQGFADQLANAEVMPGIPEMGSVWDPAKAGLTLLVKGEKDAAGAAQYVKDEVTKKIKQ